MQLNTELYTIQEQQWPQTGRHILAQYDEESIVVYQAYRPSIGHFAATHHYFGGEDFQLGRMSWIKTNFLWMMYRSGWGQKLDQEVTLAITLRRTAFDQMLTDTVHSKFIPEVYGTEKAWKQAVKESEVRLQWDPDHHPSGTNLARRAVQLGLRGETLARYAREWITDIEDISDFVANQYAHVRTGQYALLETPRERVYPAPSEAVALRIGLSRHVE
jgi:hypothetical protein